MFPLLSYRRDCVTHLNIAGLHITSSKTQRKELSILLSSYFRELLEPLKTNIQKNFHCEKVLRFVIEYAEISKLLRDAAFTW